MRDYWNDPPEEPEMPSCPADRCDGQGEYLYDGKTGGVWSCDTCAYQWVIPFPIDPVSGYASDQEIPEPIYEMQQIPCPHGKTESCDACDHLSDLAYDAARERRYFGR